MKVNCANCGKELNISPSKVNKNGNFCSLECYWGEKFQKTCKTCKRDFWVNPARRDARKYCSAKCKYNDRIRINCHQCGKEFPVMPYAASRTKYCSRACFHISSKNQVAVQCVICEKDFLAKPSQLKNNRGKYCSMACRNKGLEGEKTPKLKKECLQCKRPFSVGLRSQSQKYCSKHCSYLFRKASNFTEDGRKICSVCQNPYELSEFPEGHLKRNGFRQACKRCDLTKFLKQKYDLSIEEYESMLTSQNDRCAICLEEVMRWSVDHCHTSGAVRGLLCNNCNTGLGMFKDSPDVLRNAIKYLNKQ